MILLSSCTFLSELLTTFRVKTGNEGRIVENLHVYNHVKLNARHLFEAHETGCPAQRGKPVSSKLFRLDSSVP